MFKRLSIILLCCLLSAPAFCQSRISVETLYNKFSKERNVENVKVNGMLMLLAKPFVKKHIGNLNISSLQVLSLDECSEDTKLRFNKLAEQLNDSKYEVLLKANEKNEKTKIFARFQDETIRELIVLTTGNEPAMVRIKGKIRTEDVQNLVNSKKNEQ